MRATNIEPDGFEYFSLRAKLSQDDRDKYDRDLIAFGNATMKVHDDGTVTYVPLTETENVP